MKTKTSVTLSREVLKQIGRASLKGESRSQTIERLVREGLAAGERRDVDRKDLALINRHADELNADAIDVLEYQAEV